MTDKAKSVRPGDTVVYWIRRDGHELYVPIRLAHWLRNPAIIALVAGTFLAILSFMAVGSVVLYKKPDRHGTETLKSHV